ncbi:MAG TPA: hypothetical protein VH120_11775 [Gemmataceae bacterium]|nr:hypothetical protein [Gemmataceae bacterium]
MTIRTYQPGDEEAQAAIFNAACGQFTAFKPASADDVRKRTRARGFDPATRFYAEDGGKVVGYCTFHMSGRISHPWCLPGQESHAEPLFDAALDGLKERGVGRAYAAYHRDWPGPAQFFPAHGMPKVRDMVNFYQELTDMPTMLTRPSSPITPFEPDDLPALHAMGTDLWHGMTQKELWRQILENPFFPPESLFVIRGRTDRTPLAISILVEDPSFADPKKLDSSQPCFRLGAFGGEWGQPKRVNGLFSFVAAKDRSAFAFALDMLSHAAAKLDGTSANGVAAQVPSDVPHLLMFYQSHFRRQGSFPVYEMKL